MKRRTGPRTRDLRLGTMGKSKSQDRSKPDPGFASWRDSQLKELAMLARGGRSRTAVGAENAPGRDGCPYAFEQSEAPLAVTGGERRERPRAD